MRPEPADITDLYTTAEAGGLTRADVDAIAAPLIHALVPATRLTDVRSRGEFRAIADAVRTEIRRHQTTRAASSATGRPISAAAQARAAGQRHGVHGEIWDN